MCPTPVKPAILIGGHAEAALKRAAFRRRLDARRHRRPRAMIKLHQRSAPEYGRERGAVRSSRHPFDAFTLDDGIRKLEDMGVRRDRRLPQSPTSSRSLPRPCGRSSTRCAGIPKTCSRRPDAHPSARAAPSRAQHARDAEPLLELREELVGDRQHDQRDDAHADTVPATITAIGRCVSEPIARLIAADEPQRAERGGHQHRRSRFRGSCMQDRLLERLTRAPPLVDGGQHRARR